MSCNSMIGCEYNITNTIQVRIHISRTHHRPKTKIGTQGEKDLGNSQKKIEKISNIYILVIKGQRLVPMTFDLQVN